MRPVPPYQRTYVVDGVVHKNCRLCEKPLLKDDGRPDLRRNWHPECVDIFMAGRSAEWLRRLVFKRDHGICADCGVDCSQNAEWDADHIIPLINGGSFELTNVQTLCTRCHKAKTADENRARFKKPSGPPGPLLELMGA